MVSVETAPSGTSTAMPLPATAVTAGFNSATVVLASLEGPPHHQACGCQPCQVKRACLRKVMTLMARSSPGLFELVEAWTLEDNGE